MLHNTGIAKVWYTFNSTKIHMHKIMNASLFIIAKYWKQPIWLYLGKWLDQLWYMPTVEYYATINNNKGDLYELRWSNFWDILLSDKKRKMRL